LIALGSAGAAAPRVTTHAAPECGVAAARCTLAGWADRRGRDAVSVVVEGVGAKPIQAIYFSDGGARPAQFAQDSSGSTYLLLEYRIGKAVYLAVFRITDRLELMRKVQLRYWLSPFAAAEYSYSVEKSLDGGLTIELTRHFTGKAGTWHYPPPTQVVSIPPQD
jgi:hypothetical protein